jgi:DNA primase
LHKYEITQEEIKIFQFGWSPSYKRLILPVFNPKGELIYWQGRTFLPVTKDNPKYLNIRQSGAKNIYFQRTCPDNPTTICIVEDILSAIKVGRVCNSLALLGSYLPSALIKILSTYDRVYLWLDADKYKTSIRAMQIFTQMLGKPVIPVKTFLDPKALSAEVIKKTLNL